MGSDEIDSMLITMFTVFVGAMAILIIGLVIAFGYHVTGIPCSNAGKLLNAETNYSFSNGCWVKVNDRFLPMADVIPIERDGKTVLVPIAPFRMEINK